MSQLNDKIVVGGGHSLETLEEWRAAVARHRHSLIELLIDKPGRTRGEVQGHAKEVGVGAATLYRYLKTFETHRNVSSLAPLPRTGNRRLSKQQDKIVCDVINDFFHTSQNPSPTETAREVWRRCFKENIMPPHPNTIRKRIDKLDRHFAAAKRRGRAAARRLELIRGSFPDGCTPLETVEIDHTKLDVTVLHEQTLEPITERAWITLAIDVFSRMVTGFYISLDPPGTIATAMCLSQSILPKNELLQKYGVDAEWPCEGLMRTIHVDNAMEFHGSALESACIEWNIDLCHRPVGTPHYGGHVERMLGTLSRALKTIPGATFSNPKERGVYRSRDLAVFTLPDLEKWIAIQILEIYHQQNHSGIGTSPLKKWEEGIYGSPDQPGSGLPTPIPDAVKLRLDFMPLTKRTIQRYGVVIDDYTYWHQAFNRWVRATVPGGRGKRKFLFRRDPRNLKFIYFFDPEIQQYIEIPCTKKDMPPASIWEMRSARQMLRQANGTIDQNALFRAYEKQQRLVAEARDRKKKRNRRQGVTKMVSVETALGIQAGAKETQRKESQWEDGPVEPFSVDEL